VVVGVRNLYKNLIFFLSELFTTLLDMLATLIHSTSVSDSQSERDENKKLYTNLMKKLRKELGDSRFHSNVSVKFVRQLLPLAKQTCEVIACEPVGFVTDNRGNKINDFDSIDKKHVSLKSVEILQKYNDNLVVSFNFCRDYDWLRNNE
jgi:hypothetical protein